MKKKIIALILAVSLTSAFADIYCPQTIYCSGSNGKCVGLGIFTEQMPYNQISSGTYVFNSASSHSPYPYNHGKGWSVCSYQLNGDPNNGNSVYLNIPFIFSADQKYPNNQWDSYYQCGFNGAVISSNCPLTSYQQKLISH